MPTTTVTLQTSQAVGLSSPTKTVTPDIGPLPTTPPPTVTLTANPTSIASGGSSTLSWSSTDATSLTASGGWSGSKALPSGSELRSNLTATTAFTLTASGSGGTVSQTATVTVQPPSGTTVDARTFSSATHAGTDADPWPGSAIVAAINSLNGATGTVSIADGVWLFDTLSNVNKSNWTLQGQSQANTVLRFTGAGHVWFGNSGAFQDTKITTLTIDCRSLAAVNPHAAFRFSGAQRHTFTGNKILGHSNGGMPGTFWEGGDNNVFTGNTFDGGATGGDNCIQWQPLGGTSNSNFTIKNNVFRDVGVVVIGLDGTLIEDNTVTNPHGGFIAILCSGAWDTTSHNITINHNVVDAGGANGAAISGLPNDPGGASVIDGFQITNNTINGTFAAIHCQSYDGNNYLNNDLANNTKKNVVISGNNLHSAWGASGINCRGGAGLVDTVLVENNTLSNDAGVPNNAVDRDANTRNLTIRNNIGMPNT